MGKYHQMNNLKKESHSLKTQNFGEEIANSITHGIGAGLSIAALVILVVLASRRGDAWRIVSFSIYGATLILLYLSSTLYHSFVNPKIKNIFRILDHSTIYLLIAGSYTPITLTIIGDLYSGKELVAAMGYNSSVRSIGSAGYPAIGGALAMMGWHYPFILPVIAIPIGFLVLFNLKTPEPENEVHIREHLNIVWKKLRNRQVVGLLVISIIIFIMLFGSYMTCFPLLLGNSFGLSSLIIGLIIASVSLIAAFTSSQLSKII